MCVGDAMALAEDTMFTTLEPRCRFPKSANNNQEKWETYHDRGGPHIRDSSARTAGLNNDCWALLCNPLLVLAYQFRL